jgi:ABC-type phosphate transport system permease subunit
VGGALLLATPGALALAERRARRRRGTPFVLRLVAFAPPLAAGIVAVDDLLPLFARLGLGFGVPLAAAVLSFLLLPFLVEAFLPPYAAAWEALGEETDLLGLPAPTVRRLLFRQALPDLAVGWVSAATRGLGESVAGALVLGGGVGWPSLGGPANSLAAALLAEGAGAPPGSRWARALGGVVVLLVALALAGDRLARRRAGP